MFPKGFSLERQAAFQVIYVFNFRLFSPERYTQCNRSIHPIQGM